MAEQRKGRTLSLTDEEWAKLKNLASVEGRTPTRQVIYMTEMRIAAFDELQNARYHAASAEMAEAHGEQGNAADVDD